MIHPLEHIETAVGPARTGAKGSWQRAKGSLSRCGGLANRPNKLINLINYSTNKLIN